MAVLPTSSGGTRADSALAHEAGMARLRKLARDTPADPRDAALIGKTVEEIIARIKQ